MCTLYCTHQSCVCVCYVRYPPSSRVTASSSSQTSNSVQCRSNASFQKNCIIYLLRFLSTQCCSYQIKMHSYIQNCVTIINSITIHAMHAFEELFRFLLKEDSVVHRVHGTCFESRHTVNNLRVTTVVCKTLHD